MLARVAFGLVLLLASEVLADFDSGCTAFEQGDFAAARKEWAPLVEQGLPQAQFRLGCLYTFGQGVPQDYGLALRLYRLAAETLLVWGTADRLIVPAYAARWQALIPGARLAMLEGAAHMLPYEQPEAFARTLSGFLA